MEIDKEKKQFYASAEMEVIEVAQGDIICTSGFGSNVEGWEDDEM